MLHGVTSVLPGYAGGTIPNPTYEAVCSGNTGHAEVIQVHFDPSVIPFDDLLEIFFHLHDPTTLNRQGYDTGTQYRSIVLYTTPDQKIVTQKKIEKLNASAEYKSKIVTEVKPLDMFYPAEDYHKNYYEKNSYQSYCQVVIDPKLQHLREKYSNKLK